MIYQRKRHRCPHTSSQKSVICIPQSSRSGATPSDDLVVYPGHFLKRVGSAEIQSMHSFYSTTKIGKETHRSPGDQRRIAVTPTLVKKKKKKKKLQTNN